MPLAREVLCLQELQKLYEAPHPQSLHGTQEPVVCKGILMVLGKIKSFNDVQSRVKELSFNNKLDMNSSFRQL